MPEHDAPPLTGHLEAESANRTKDVNNALNLPLISTESTQHSMGPLESEPNHDARNEREPKIRASHTANHGAKLTRHAETGGESANPWQASSVTGEQQQNSRSSSIQNRKQAIYSLRDKARSLLLKRQGLPIWSHAQAIRQGLKDKDVLLLVGETGSGKSTQVPQFLSDEPWCRPRSITITADGSEQNVKVGGCIAITEPRRVAAITLARRVAEEMGSLLGSASPTSRVGYSVRFDNSTSPSTRIKFLTEGMLLQEMLHDPWLRQYSVVVVDEVHERAVSIDLVLGFLRRMVTGTKEGRGGVPLKVVIMSATADTRSLLEFFEEGFTEDQSIEAGSVRGSDTVCSHESESEWSGFSSPVLPTLTPRQVRREKRAAEMMENYGVERIEDIPVSKERRQRERRKRNRRLKAAQEASPKEQEDLERDASPVDQEADHNHQAPRDPFSETTRTTKDLSEDMLAYGIHKTSGSRALTAGSKNVSVNYIEGRQFPVQVFYSPEPVQDFVDAALRTVYHIHYKEPLPGDILVFLTGQETVESLENLVNEYALGLGPEVPKLLVLPLFAALPQAAQQRVFQPTPPKTRKVILATNVAETSVTVSGVRFVVDCGKSKVKQFRSRLGLASLLVRPISQSAATQRKGRAGREAAGKCYRLYTEKDYLALAPSNTPEMLRSDLAQAILNIKARGISDITSFPFLSPPPHESLEKALLQLYQLGGLSPLGEITPTGLQIARLPLSTPLGRVLLAAAEPQADCLADVIDIISCFSVENIFQSLHSDEAREQAESARRPLYRREGDHLTLLATVRAYAAENADRRAWAERYFVSHRAMQAVMVSPITSLHCLAPKIHLPTQSKLI